MTHRIQSGWKNWKEKGIGDFVLPKNKSREEVGCGGNEDVKIDEWSHQAGQK